MQSKPILHARDHRRGGADPVEIVYVDERLLTSDSATVTFDEIPAWVTALALEWLAAAVTEDAVLKVFFNGDTPGSVSYDTRWNIGLANQLGTRSSATDGDGDMSTEGGGIGFVPQLTSSRVGWGRIVLPAFRNDDGDGGLDVRMPAYTGHGGWNWDGSGAPDQWIAAGYAETAGPLTSMVVGAQALSDLSPVDLKAGSRFTLTGF